MEKTQEKLLGYCGVDSGTILLTDPGYIDSQWTNPKEIATDINQLFNPNKSLQI